MLGQPLKDVVENDMPVREAGLFGMHGVQVNVTDGRYVYMRAPTTADNVPLYNYTLMPTNMRGFFEAENLRSAHLAPPFSFTKDCPTLKTPARSWGVCDDVRRTWLWDVQNDPAQSCPISDAAVEKQMVDHMVRLMRECDSPPEQFIRLGLEKT